MKALIADNHEIVRIGLKHLLSRWTVIEAADADSALKLHKKHKPDVTVLEVRIPGDGLACLTRIKLGNPDAHVLMLSGHDNPTYAARAVALGAQGYISKTAAAADILAAVKAVANGEDIWTRSSLRQISGSIMSANGSDVHITKRESEVLRQLALGLSNKEIGLALGISYETVKEHVQHILRKLGVTDRTQAAVWAVRKELV
jgi:DNA-binding NarL/FixJ family response regulator